MLTSDFIQHAIDEGWIKNADPSQIEGGGLNLRTKKVFKMLKAGCISEGNREKPEYIEYSVPGERCYIQPLFRIATTTGAEGEGFFVHRSYCYYKVTVEEEFDFPPHIVGLLKGRRSAGENALQVICSDIVPGYPGPISFGLANLGPEPYPLKMHDSLITVRIMPMTQIRDLLLECVDDPKPYDGPRKNTGEVE